MWPKTIEGWGKLFGFISPSLVCFLLCRLHSQVGWSCLVLRRLSMLQASSMFPGSSHLCNLQGHSHVICKLLHTSLRGSLCPLLVLSPSWSQSCGQGDGYPLMARPRSHGQHWTQNGSIPRIKSWGIEPANAMSSIPSRALHVYIMIYVWWGKGRDKELPHWHTLTLSVN